ncbi:hypothetical protein [Psychromonas sp. Urea-02u-13]|uniref:hypothetical protein n=1 Tax=Psychromonas sp. Urea-02u-13 TaxID=2058326 RepID=UPI000C329809|nr:hypothetical protein [Psychromonas sp. Urea-02u-13]PKG37037.1 hypothetical protein CXF74_21000 [Psychromonas sp. Urea-02u-13]
MLKKEIALLLITFSGFTFANCSVPDSLDDMTFINVIDPTYSNSNPNAGAIAKVTYSNKKYVTEFLNRELGPFYGRYTYSVLDKDNGIGLYLGDEKDPLNKPSHSVLFKCLTNTYGTAIFTQISGVNEPIGRQNMLSYTVIKNEQ